MVDDPKQGGEERDAPPYKPTSPLAQREEEVLAFWEREHIFEKSLKQDAPKGEYVFYDGPPFATGLPHFGHILQSAIKDAIPRYRTMRGYRVARQWGWDCHGLPLENQIEQQLGIKTKRDIEELGIEKFNTAARDAVLQYADDWKRIIPRMGRWVDMEHDYKTMDTTYTESVWWAFKNLYDRGLIYEGFKAMHFCPRCGTTLSNNEVALGYQDIEDFAVFVRLPLVEEPGTSLLIWTTTPWTLPGNVAAAVKADAPYAKVRVGSEHLVVAKELVEKVFGAGAQVEGELLGKDLVGKAYEPPFAYFADALHKHKTHAWKVYAAPYVTLEDGTGIVHLAPAYGAEDLELAQREKIPLIHHVGDDGRFVAAVSDFAGLPVKPKGHHRDTDAKIVAWLREHGQLFKDETITHSYPHCWRCDTPLLNWAANSWFVKVASLKDKLVAQNASVRWVPQHVGSGRFHNLLESAPDWAISRSRYWGAPIPAWRNSKTHEVKIIGSIEELLGLVRRSGNRYFVMRHGQARSNVEMRLDSHGDPENHLTDVGRAQAAASAQELKAQGIDLIVVSPFVRTRETAAIVQQELGLPDSAVMVDERLREFDAGVYDGKTIMEWEASFTSVGEQFGRAPEAGEMLTDTRKRVGEFLFEVERRYAKKNILIISHGDPTWILSEVAAGTSYAELAALGERTAKLARGYLSTGGWRELAFVPYPHNERYELDLHRPYIDEVPMGDPVLGEWKRVPDVFDCWFESGSMPYASHHYPFTKKEFDPTRFFGLGHKGYPANFIAESVDQTRGWFYSLIVLGVALFGVSPYEAVVTNGLVLAEDGRKMSKKLKNYPDPMELVEQFGADALRYYLLSSAVNRGEDLRFSARGVEEISKKLLMRLDNVRSFYELYAPNPERTPSEKSLRGSTLLSQDKPLKKSAPASAHVLDRWILSRLGQLVRETTDGYECYELDTATRPLASFIDDLSTWYLRRSRDRFKAEGEDKAQAFATLRYVLLTVAQVMAPAMPFFAEDLYQKLRAEGDAESVHLTRWPTPPAIDARLTKDMAAVRALVSQALEAREKAGIKVRQPLGLLKIKDLTLSDELVELIEEEVNVKEVVADASLAEPLWLNTELTPELREEGMLRDLIRMVQDLRKTSGLTISDRPTLIATTSAQGERLFTKFEAVFLEETNLAALKVEVNEALEQTGKAPLPLALRLE